MKNFVGVLSLVLLSFSCVTPKYGDRNSLAEQGDPDIVVYFRSWDSISITKPHQTEGPFELIFDQTGAERALTRMTTTRKLAVIVCGYAYAADAEAEQQETWARFFQDLKFERLVFVRGGQGAKLGGLPIIRELQLGRGAMAPTPSKEA